MVQLVQYAEISPLLSYGMFEKQTTPQNILLPESPETLEVLRLVL